MSTSKLAWELIGDNKKREGTTKQQKLFQRLEELVIQLGYEIDYKNMGGLIMVDKPEEYEAYERGENEDYETRLIIDIDPPDYWMGKKVNKTYQKEQALREAIKEFEEELARR